MKKIYYSILAFVLFSFISTPVYSSEPDTYFSASAGYAMLEDIEVADPVYNYNLEYKPGYFVGVAVGHHVKKIRGEIELGIQRNEIDAVSVNGGPSVSQDSNDEIRLLSLLLNLYYDFKNRSPITPYITAGLGLGNVSVDGSNEHDPVSEYQIGAGVSFRFSDNVVMDLKYRYLATSEVEIDSTRFDYVTHNAILGIRVYFE